ncbi:DUF4174 domain-containing protein [Sphingomonas sp. MMS24-J13]|uniref:DUF4174 domain-containing protein n=1 Tax=Sphingomonas sp. MMS24-J13 TaxID=3238686 RepID=UPI00384C20F3
MRLPLLTLSLLLAAPAGATATDLRSVAGMQFHNRVLLVFAPSLKDPRLATQSAVMAKAALEASNRDLVFVQVAEGRVLGAHDKADSLQRRYHITAPIYRAFLIGKDGKVASEANGPVDATTLMRKIDAMPMRQEELRRAHAGQRKTDR